MRYAVVTEYPAGETECVLLTNDIDEARACIAHKDHLDIIDTQPFTIDLHSTKGQTVKQAMRKMCHCETKCTKCERTV